MSLLAAVDFVLVEPAEGGNLGSCCRALMNCGAERLLLVRPQVEDWAEARKMAVHAAALLQSAGRFDSIDAAVAGAHWVVGTSVRARKHADRKPPLGPTEFIARLREMPAGARAALLFGPERTGLTNAQLGRCTNVLCLPTAEAYSSMNLAQAVLAAAWTLRLADLNGPAEPATTGELARAGELEGLIEHAQRTLAILGYLDPQNPRLILDELRKVFARARLDPRELNLIRGIFHRMDVWIARHGGPDSPNQPRGSGRRRRSNEKS